MPAKMQTFKFTQTIEASAAAVYRAFTRSTALREWFCDAAQAEPRPGGRLYMWWVSGYYTSGEFRALTPDKKVVFTWHGRGEPAPTQVTVTVSAKGNATRVTLTHGEIGAGKAWAPIAAEFERGWKVALENLRSTLEAGPDLRIVSRPMVGIIGGDDLTPELAAKLGVPVKTGLRLDGLVEGMGAQTAGLQKDDVIVKLGGKKVLGFQQLASALQGHRAGDVVPVVFYRGAEKKTLQMKLSARPLPEIPPTPQALAEVARPLYAETDAALTKCFEGATEEAAERRPLAGEWNAKEILAHLILGERGQRDFIADLAAGEERWYDGLGGNIPAPMSALLAIFPTVPELLQELRRTEAEIVALLAALPPEFAARKSSYWRLGVVVPQATLHIHEHLGQLKAALEAAQ